MVPNSRSAGGSACAPAAGCCTVAATAGCLTAEPSSLAAALAVPERSERTLGLDGTVHYRSDWNKVKNRRIFTWILEKGFDNEVFYLIHIRYLKPDLLIKNYNR